MMQKSSAKLSQAMNTAHGNLLDVEQSSRMAISETKADDIHTTKIWVRM